MRDQALESVRAHFDGGGFLDDLRTLVSVPTMSQSPDHGGDIARYLNEVIGARVAEMGFTTQILPNPSQDRCPILFAEHIEDPAIPTVLMYGHGDVVFGQDEQWWDGLSPWTVTERDDRWYGRGTADNKAQHLINLTALGHVIESRDALGFNVKIILESGEEVGSPGLEQVVAENTNLLAADILIASDGPRLAADQPTLVLGSRGGIGFKLVADFRDGAHHSGNWGGLLKDPCVRLAQAIASITDANGKILIPEWRPDSLTDVVRGVLADCVVTGGEGGPDIDDEWGEPGLTAAEKVYGWNSFSVVYFDAGDPARPVNAILPAATALCGLRTVVGTDREGLIPALRDHLDAHGFGDIEIEAGAVPGFIPTRLRPDHACVGFVSRSIEETLGRAPVVIPNIGGGLPNYFFVNSLNLPTIWIPHSYPGCRQHGPNEHVLPAVMRQGLEMMTGLFWDMGEQEFAGLAFELG